MWAWLRGEQSIYFHKLSIFVTVSTLAGDAYVSTWDCPNKQYRNRLCFLWVTVCYFFVCICQISVWHLVTCRSRFVSILHYIFLDNDDRLLVWTRQRDINNLMILPPCITKEIEVLLHTYSWLWQRWVMPNYPDLTARVAVAN